MINEPAQAEAVEKDVETRLDEILTAGLRRNSQIQNIVLASEQGLVIAYKSRVRTRGMALSALAPLLHDAGETAFKELSLGPLGELWLVGSSGGMYQARSEDTRIFVLVSAVGEPNLGLLRMVASEILRAADTVLQNMV